MSAYLKHSKKFAWMFIFLILNSSCVVYKKTPLTFEELSGVKSLKVKLKTTPGNTFRTYWTSIKDDKVEIIEKAKVRKLQQKHILNASYFGPEYKIVDLDQALQYEGNVLIETKKRKYQFFDIKKEGEKIVGYTYMKTNQDKVLIPKDEIATIKIQNKAASRAGNILLGLGGGFFFTIGISLAAIASNPNSFNIKL